MGMSIRNKNTICTYYPVLIILILILINQTSCLSAVFSFFLLKNLCVGKSLWHTCNHSDRYSIHLIFPFSFILLILLMFWFVIGRSLSYSHSHSAIICQKNGFEKKRKEKQIIQFDIIGTHCFPKLG